MELNRLRKEKKNRHLLILSPKADTYFSISTSAMSVDHLGHVWSSQKDAYLKRQRFQRPSKCEVAYIENVLTDSEMHSKLAAKPPQTLDLPTHFTLHFSQDC